jgi:putative ABC transport system permease protein
MQFVEGIRLALRQIWTEKLKSFFSLLGVIVGVMFLIVVVSIVEGMDRYIREDLASVVFGVNTVTLRRLSDGPNFDGSNARARQRRPRITYEDWEAVRDQITVPASVGAESSTGGEIVADNGQAVENVQIHAVSPEIMTIRDWEVERGRTFSAQEAERGTAVVVLGSETADLLFENLDPIGRRVRIRGFPYRVIGILEEQGSLFGQSLDNQAIAPARSAIQAVTNPRGIVDQVVAQTREPADLRTLQRQIEGIMRTRRRLRPADENNFSVETAEDTLSFWDNISRVLFVALPGLVGISLVVGGIVIMNIMLVSVMERTREIGVRKALGARRRDILTQVLVESVTLSGVGAALGVAVGVGLTYLVRVLSPLPAAVDAKWIALGVSLGVLVGVMSGVYPAAQASKLAPVDALRHE